LICPPKRPCTWRIGYALFNHADAIILNAYYHNDFHNNAGTPPRYCHLARQIIDIMRKNPRMSIMKIIQQLQHNKVLILDLDKDSLTVRNCVFTIIGLTSRLYLPKVSASQEQFEIDTQGAKRPIKQQSVLIKLRDLGTSSFAPLARCYRGGV